LFATFTNRNGAAADASSSPAVLSVGRKNGKLTLTGAPVLAHLVGPVAIRNGEIYSAATEREQAAIVFKTAAQMVRADAELLAMSKIVDSTKTMDRMHNGSVYRAISAEAGTKHGLNPSVVIYDELAQARNGDLYDVLDTAMGARDEPLFVVISTGVSRNWWDVAGIDMTATSHQFLGHSPHRMTSFSKWLPLNSIATCRSPEVRRVRAYARPPLAGNLRQNQNSTRRCSGHPRNGSHYYRYDVSIRRATRGYFVS
jgi:hypothetical protein